MNTDNNNNYTPQLSILHLQHFERISEYTSHLALGIQLAGEIIINVLSCFWAIHLILRLINTSRIHKLQTSPTSDGFREIREKYKILRNKNSILLAICISEWILVFSALIISFFGIHVANPKVEFYLNSLGYPPFDHSEANKHLIFRLSNSIFLTSFMSMLILIRIITQYMHSCYSYFKHPIRLKYMIIYFYFIIAVIFLFGIYDSWTIIVQSILFPIMLIIEYVLYIIYAIKLNRCLYDRYFDSKLHEYQSKGVISYYRKAYIGYKVCSISLAIAFLCYIVVFSIISIIPQIYLLGPILFKYWNLFYFVFLCQNFFANFFSIFAFVFFTVPYVLFSLGYLYTQVVRWYRFRNNDFYSNPGLISALLQHQNTSYRRM